MYLAPGAYCSYKTSHDTKVDYQSSKIDVNYYNYEGNNLPMVGMCRLAEKTKNILNIGDNILETGMFGGLLSGNCGFFVVMHNKDLQVDHKISIYRNVNEFAEAE
jgi:hypothetical protein